MTKELRRLLAEAHEEGEMGGEAWWALALASQKVLPTLLDLVDSVELLMYAHEQMGPSFIPHDEIEVRMHLANLEDLLR